MKSLYVFGNEYLEEDKLAREVADRLDNVKVVHCKSPEDLLEAGEEVMILDVVKGTDRIVIVTDPAKIKTNKLVSLHDLDLGFFLNLLKELGMGKKIKIIGIPQRGNPAKLAREVKACM